MAPSFPSAVREVAVLVFSGATPASDKKLRSTRMFARTRARTVAKEGEASSAAHPF